MPLARGAASTPAPPMNDSATLGSVATGPLARSPGSLKVLGNRVLCEPEGAQKSPQGRILIPRTVHRPTAIGRVLCVGTKVPQVGLDKGQRVFFRPGSGRRLEWAEGGFGHLLLLDPEDILGILPDGIAIRSGLEPVLA